MNIGSLFDPAPDPVPEAARKPAPLTPQQAERAEQTRQLDRVRGRIGELVLAFVRERFASGRREFVIAELHAFVTAAKPGAPGSPERLLRDGRQRGLFDYEVVNRKQSHYRITKVANQPQPQENAT